MNPTLTVLLYSSFAAATAAIGALALLKRGGIPTSWVGWANAVAAGLMLGIAYVLAAAGWTYAPWTGALGAIAGIGFIYWTHLIHRTEDLDLNRLDEASPDYGHQVFLVQSLHSTSEGVAIGVAAALNLNLGIFTALALAAHNVAEGTVLTAVLRARAVRLGEAAGLAVLTNATQVLLALASFVAISALPSLLPFALGFAVGALVHLVMMELLPESYDQAGHTSIALVTSVATGLVVLLNGFLA